LLGLIETRLAQIPKEIGSLLPLCTIRAGDGGGLRPPQRETNTLCDQGQITFGAFRDLTSHPSVRGADGVAFQI